MDLGKIISSVRQERGFTQSDFAVKCDIAQAYLSEIESNKKEPNLSTLKTISKELQIPLPILFFMALDENDIPTNKKIAYSTLEPILKSAIRDIFKV